MSIEKKSIGEFFLHIAQYGLFNYNNGEIYFFNNPYAFVPMNALASYQNELQKLFPEDASAVIEWLGRVDGRTASMTMISKYGFPRKNIEKLLSAGTLTGLGLLSLKKIDENSVIVSSSNSPFALCYKKKYGVSKNGVDFYILGALAGADVPIFGKNMFAKETTCVGRGDPRCEYEFYINIPYKAPIIIKKTLGLNAEEIMEKITQSFLRRMKKYSISLRSKDIVFGDGRFIFKGIEGIAIPLFVVIMFNELIRRANKESYKKIIENISKAYTDTLPKLSLRYKTLNNLDLIEILKQLEMFGFGKFNIKSLKEGKLIIENSSNNYPKEYNCLFGFEKEGVDFLVCKLLESLLKRYYSQKIVCNELSCIAARSAACTFEVQIKLPG